MESFCSPGKGKYLDLLGSSVRQRKMSYTLGFSGRSSNVDCRPAVWASPGIFLGRPKTESEALGWAHWVYLNEPSGHLGFND